MATVNLRPDSEGSVQQWTPVPASDPPVHWTKVDDLVGFPDEDATYVWTDLVSDIEEFNHATSDLLTGATITNVRVTARMRGSCNGNTANIGLRIGINRYPASTDETLTISYANYYKEWANNPSTFPPSPWTKGAIDSLQSSLQALVFALMGARTHCTQIYITVTYTPLTPVAGKGLVSWTP